MKTVGYSQVVWGWRVAILFAVLAPNLAMAAVPGSLAQKACESQAQARFQKKVVEVEMASIVGDVGQTEVIGKRESLHRTLEAEQGRCVHFVHASRARAAESSPATL